MKQYKVVEILTSTRLVLNCGKNFGIKETDEFLVYGLTKPIKDPDTGEELGQAEIVRGKGKVIHLQEKLCTIESSLYDEGTSRIIKRVQPFSVFSGSTEEEVTGHREIKKFEEVQIGDFAKLIKV